MRGTIGLFKLGIGFVCFAPCLPSTGSSLPLRRQTKEMVRAPGYAAADIDSHFLGRFNKERFSGHAEFSVTCVNCFSIPEAILRRRFFMEVGGTRSYSVNILITK
jgi:hypothetical protein